MVVVMMNPVVVSAHPGRSCRSDFFLLGASLNSKKKNVKHANVNIIISTMVFITGCKPARVIWEVVIKNVAKAAKLSSKKKVRIAASLCL